MRRGGLFGIAATSHSGICVAAITEIALQVIFQLPTLKTFFSYLHTLTTMNLRQKLQIVLLAVLILFAFASYHEGSGSTIWLQWLAVVTIMIYMFIFDVSFMNESSFIFDPDAENWRRKTVRSFE